MKNLFPTVIFTNVISVVIGGGLGTTALVHLGRLEQFKSSQYYRMMEVDWYDLCAASDDAL